MKNNTVTLSKTNQIDVKTPIPMDKVRLNPKSLRCAINAQCYECIYDKSDIGSWRQQVQACPSTLCPLYRVRPTSNAALEKLPNDLESAA